MYLEITCFSRKQALSRVHSKTAEVPLGPERLEAEYLSESFAAMER